MNSVHPYISVVIPTYNEEEILPELFHRVNNVLNNSANIGDYEIILVNDGSADRSMEVMLELCQHNPKLKVIELSRNFGHQVALTAGIDFASGDALILMDGDLQDPPELIPRLIEKWKGGWDVVYAVRKGRKENIFKRIMYKMFYRILRFISEIDMPLDSGDFSLMDKKIVNVLKSMPERNRFIRGLRSWIGFKQTELEYERERRFAGRPKYTLSKLMRLAFDGIFSFSTLPLRIATVMGFLVSMISFSGILLVLYFKLFTNKAIPGWAATVIPVLFLGGVQLICIGALGEYIARIFSEVKQRPHYVIKFKKGFDD